MLIHLTPRIYNRYSNVSVKIIDMVIPELGMILTEGKDIIIRTPYPNKNYKAICRKIGRKAILGIIIETDRFINDFTVVTRWSVNDISCKHKVHYHVLDSEYDAVTDSSLLWNEIANTPFHSRNPGNCVFNENINNQPRMLVCSDDLVPSSKIGNAYDYYHKKGVIHERVEYFMMPSIERERLTTNHYLSERLPSIYSIFHCLVKKDLDTTLKLTSSNHAVFPVSIKEWFEEQLIVLNETSTLPPDFLKNEYLSIGNELLKHERFWLANTNDLFIKLKRHSKTYNDLSCFFRHSINNVISGPVLQFSQHLDSMG